MIAPDRLALGIEPNSSLSVLDMMKCAQLAEKKGFAATWVAEGRGGEVFALLSALAMGTSRMRLGAGILPVFVRSPWIVAAGAATVDEVSGGRFMLGLGAGHKSVIEDRYGLAYDRPTQRMREVTDIVRRALSGESVSVEGEIFRLSGAQLSRRPVRSDVPIYIAGTGSRVLELAGEIADGAFLCSPPKTPSAPPCSISVTERGAQTEIRPSSILSRMFSPVSRPSGGRESSRVGERSHISAGCLTTAASLLGTDFPARRNDSKTPGRRMTKRERCAQSPTRWCWR